jgi:UDP-N-acetylmuramoyl-tripeptide--D-alanyl-D-alanine ligase
MTRPFSLAPAEVASAMGAREHGPWPGRRITRGSIDSRTLQAGDLFFAIRGPRFDGHAFLAEAVARGAAGLVVSEPAALAALPGPVPALVVGDTVAALQALAAEVRRRSGARVVAITGSTGKTTTKEIAAALLEARYVTLRNRGNLNNHLGLPLSLLDLTAGAEVAVMELGMNHAGEIRRLVDIATPDVRVWTNVGTAHLEYFGTQDAIADAKAEILDGAGAGTALVVNADDPRVIGRAVGFPGRTVTFGIDAAADVRATGVEDAGFDGLRATVRTRAGEAVIASPLAGRAHLLNVLAAMAVALDAGVPLEAMPPRIAALRPAAHRGEVRRLARDVVVVDDAYNASPGALQHLLSVAAHDRSGRRRVAFLGEMLELGPASGALHEACGRTAAAAGVAALVTVGGEPARALGQAAREAGLPAVSVRHLATSEEAAAHLAEIVRPGDLVLVKGSRGIRMERVVERLAEEFD